MNGFYKVLLVIAVATLAHARAEAACGKFDVSKGDVKVKRAGKESPAPQGSQICSGDEVVTGDEGRAKIVMDDGNVLNISPKSNIVLEKYEYNPTENKKKVLLNVLKGKVRAATARENMYNDKSDDGQANTFQVKTKSAVAGVRGTDFLTGFDPSTSKAEIVTFRGKVDVGQPGPGGTLVNVVSVTVGQRSITELGKAPEPPKPVPANEMKEMNTETKADTAKSAGNSESHRENGDKSANSDDKSANGNAESGDKGANGGDKTASTGDKSANGGASAETNTNAGRAPASTGPAAGSPPPPTLMMGSDAPPPPPDTFKAPPPCATCALPRALPPPPKCDFCNSAVQSGPARLKVNIVNPNM
jgi:hypothetical protein